MSGSTEAVLAPTVVTGRRPGFAPAREGGAAWVDPGPPPAPGADLGLELPSLRAPRGSVTVNGRRLDRLLLECDVTNNGYFSPDSFNAVFALEDAGPDGLAFWADTDDLEAEVFVGLGEDTPPSISVFAGRVDDIAFDFRGRHVTVSGRDYSADLMEAQTTEKWPNRTASEIATELAGRRGLTPVVTATTVRSGSYYQIEHARLSDETTEWNLLSYLAEQEGMDVYVKGRELHFKPPPDARGAARWSLRYKPSQDGAPPELAAAGFKLRQSKTISREISVKVVSWNSKQNRAFTVTRSTTLRSKGSSGASTARTPYVFRIPGLTEEQAIREAERRLADITKHHRALDYDGPGHPDIDIRTIVALSGTGTSFDQDYRLTEIRRSISQDGGLSMHFHAQNLPPESRAAL